MVSIFNHFGLKHMILKNKKIRKFTLQISFYGEYFHPCEMLGSNYKGSNLNNSPLSQLNSIQLSCKKGGWGGVIWFREDKGYRMDC